MGRNEEQEYLLVDLAEPRVDVSRIITMLELDIESSKELLIRDSNNELLKHEIATLIRIIKDIEELIYGHD